MLGSRRREADKKSLSQGEAKTLPREAGSLVHLEN
jgi:hypothetical protein